MSENVLLILLALSKSEYALQVREIVVGAVKKRCGGPGTYMESFMADLNPVLPMCLRRLPSLRTFPVVAPT